MNQSILEGIFNLIIENKTLPNYQAERRIDIFINYFISRIISSYLGNKTEFICPEFPLKKQKNNQSTKIDYLCKSENEIIFVELKTDTSSLKASQANMYLECNWNQCLYNFKIITNSVTNKIHKKKYKTLTSVIDRLEFSSDKTTIRIIYLSPLPKENSIFAKNISIINPNKLNELQIPLYEDEGIVWEFIKALDLYIFEIKHN